MNDNVMIVHEDKKNKIVISKDSYKGITIQLIRKGKSAIPESVIDSVRLCCDHFGPRLKEEVRMEIGKMTDKMRKINENDTMIEGIFQDYRSMK